jgi:hypothetical protein
MTIIVAFVSFCVGGLFGMLLTAVLIAGREDNERD